MNSLAVFSLTPPTAGDIIDRAVRLYRRHFAVLLRIVVAPCLISYAGGIVYTFGLRNFSATQGDRRILLTVALVLGGGLLYLLGRAAALMMTGAAARMLLAHWHEGVPLRARDVYAAVWARFGSLLGATLMVGLILMGAGTLIYTLTVILVIAYVALAAAALRGAADWAQGVFHFTFGLLAVAGFAAAAVVAYARIVYVPAALMVEGKGVFSAIGRSFTLATGNFWRTAAILTFEFCVGWSLFWLLDAPLESLAWWNGVEINPFSEHAPLWFSMARQTLVQVSEIARAPLSLLGFTLLYLDNRVRREGFDLELQAHRTLPPARTFERPPPAALPDESSTGEQSTGQPSAHELPDEESLNVATIALDRADDEPLPHAPLSSSSDAVEVVPLAASSVVQPSRVEMEPLAEGIINIAPASPHSTTTGAGGNGAPRFCGQCGARKDAGGRFCTVCGAIF